jgi:hypothetical protein
MYQNVSKRATYLGKARTFNGAQMVMPALSAGITAEETSKEGMKYINIGIISVFQNTFIV